jgi:hypothetical protein
MPHSPQKWKNGAFLNHQFWNLAKGFGKFDFSKSPMPHQNGKMGHLLMMVIARRNKKR